MLNYVFFLSLLSKLYSLLTECVMTLANDDQDQAVESKTNDESTPPQRGDEAEGAEGKKKKKKGKKSLMATLFDPFIVLYTGWRTYARQKVVFAGIALATLYMTVIGFDSITIGGCVTGQ